MGWDQREDRNRIPLVVDDGIIANRRDMVRVLRDLGHVRYAELVGDETRASGEGLVAHVAAHDTAATIVANRRIYLNVNGFDFLRLGRGSDGAAFDLVTDNRTLRLEPLSDPIRDGITHEESAYVPAEALSGLIGAQLSEDDLAELFQEDDDE